MCCCGDSVVNIIDKRQILYGVSVNVCESIANEEEKESFHYRVFRIGTYIGIA